MHVITIILANLAINWHLSEKNNERWSMPFHDLPLIFKDLSNYDRKTYIGQVRYSLTQHMQHALSYNRNKHWYF